MEHDSHLKRGDWRRSPYSHVRMLPAGEFARVWASLPHLTPEEAESYVRDIRAARDSYPRPRERWA
jgi:hypothetical protein